MKNIYPILILSCLLSCKNSPTAAETAIVVFSQEDSIEARELALWFSGDLTPPDAEVTRFLHELYVLREIFKDSATVGPAMSNRFLTPWTTNMVGVQFDSSTAILVRNGEYSGWNNLEPHLQPDSIRFHGTSSWFSVYYSPLLNPWRLCELYQDLPGVVFTEPSMWTFAGGTYPIFPGQHYGEMSYIFVQGYSHLPGPFHYFYFQNNKPLYGGVFSWLSDPKPEWWEQAKTALDSFVVWQKYK